MNQYVTLVLFLVCVLFISSCISPDPVADEKRLSMYFKADNIGNSFTIDENGVIIDEFKFAIDKFTLYGDDNLIIETGNQITALIFAYTKDIDGYRLIIDVGLGFSDDFRFNRYNMFLEPVSGRQNILDDDFFGEEINYSVIINGEINGNSFEFKSSEEFEKSFDHAPAQLNDRNETIAFRKNIDVQHLFVNEEGEFLDPRNEENEQDIIQNIYNNLQLTASAERFSQ